MSDASLIAVVAIAAVLIVRALIGHRYRRKRRINITIEWGDGETEQPERGVSTDNPPE